MQSDNDDRRAGLPAGRPPGAGDPQSSDGSGPAIGSAGGRALEGFAPGLEIALGLVFVEAVACYRFNLSENAEAQILK